MGSVICDAVLLICLRYNSARFGALWGGSDEGYPSPSEADYALCSMIAFYTQDPAQIERQVDTLAEHGQMSASVQDLVSLALKRVRTKTPAAK